jgi:glycogen(starch) synthase
VMSWRKWSMRGAADVPDEWRAYYQLVREALQAADSVVAVSAFLANEMRAQYATDQRIDVIHNGWPATPDALVTFDANDRRGTLLAGRIWDEGKNIALAAEAAHGWDSGDVCLAGERAHPDGGVADVPSPLQPLGFLSRSELDARLRRSQVYLSTARYDPFGLLPLQAALNGCALLLSDIPSYREVWDGAAQFFGSDDVSDLRHQWRTLLQDGTRISNLRRRAYERATRAYTPRRMIDAYLGVYTRVRARAAA